MTLFNLSRWIAKEITGVGDRDMKIYIIGPPGSGKSKTALRLAQAIGKWVSWYKHKDFDHADDYFKLDGEHLAVISSDDLYNMLTTYPPMYQVRIADDCGNAAGFDSRQSMSRKNMDLNSIWSTNRTRHCVTIVTMHDLNFNDLRQVLLADIVIDMREWYQAGRFRMAKLWKIRMVERSKGNRGALLARFMTYEHDRWVVQESLACEMPSPEVVKAYDEIRAIKDKENTERVQKMLLNIKDEMQTTVSKPKCVRCKGTDVRVIKEGLKCKTCGYIEIGATWDSARERTRPTTAIKQEAT
jgi:ribosomal protein L37AE/L43A